MECGLVGDGDLSHRVARPRHCSRWLMQRSTAFRCLYASSSKPGGVRLGGPPAGGARPGGGLRIDGTDPALSQVSADSAGRVGTVRQKWQWGECGAYPGLLGGPGCRELPFLGVMGAHGELITRITQPNLRFVRQTSDMRVSKPSPPAPRVSAATLAGCRRPAGGRSGVRTP